MTNHPRYNPPPQPAWPSARRRPHGAGYPGPHGHSGYPAAALRLAIRDTAATDASAAAASAAAASAGLSAQPSDPYRGAPQQPHAPVPPQARPAPKRSRAGALTAGALAVAVVSAGIGGGVVLMAQARQPAAAARRSPRGTQRSRCQPPRRVRRTGRRQGGAQRRQAGDRHGACLRGRFRDHPVLRRPDPDQ